MRQSFEPFPPSTPLNDKVVVIAANWEHGLLAVGLVVLSKEIYDRNRSRMTGFGEQVSCKEDSVVRRVKREPVQNITVSREIVEWSCRREQGLALTVGICSCHAHLPLLLHDYGYHLART